ncbi:hypothetical protein ACFLQ6_00800 [Thermoproteota archaeon]
MFRLYKFLIPALLVGLLIIGFSKPVEGQVGPPNLMVDPTSINTRVSTEFSIDIWITDIPENNRMERAYIRVTWLRADMERVDQETNQPDSWAVSGLMAPDSIPLPPEDWISFEFTPNNGIVITEDRRWATITFHCLVPGITTILVEGEANMTTGSAAPQTFVLDPIEVIVYQVLPVGGISTPINKLEILTPYIALAGLIAVISTVYIIRRRKD